MGDSANYDSIDIDSATLCDYAEDIKTASGELTNKELDNLDNDTNIPARSNLYSAYQESQSLDDSINSSSQSFAENIINFGNVMENINNDACNNATSNTEG